MQDRPYNWLADVAIAFDRLQPRDDATRQAITELLGLGWHVKSSEQVGVVGRDTGRPSVTIAEEDVRLDEHKVGPSPTVGPPIEVKPKSAEAQELPPDVPRLKPIPSGRKPISSLWNGGPALSLPRDSGHGSTLPEIPLFRSTVARGVLQMAMQTRLADGQVRIAGLVDALACQQMIERIPREPRGVLIYGVQLLVDIGEAMDPFAKDQEDLTRWIRRLVGRDALAEFAFRDDPLTGVGLGPVSTWGEYRPPPPGTPVVLITDLGIRRAQGEPRGATYSRWRKFALRVRHAECPIIAFVPYPPTRWPRGLLHLIDIICWDRPTTVTMVRRWVRRMQGRES